MNQIMSDINFDQSEADSFNRLATFQPRECSIEGGESLVITFSKPLPEDPIVIILRGSEFTHKLQPERIDEHVLAALLPAHTIPEPVQFSVYWLPGNKDQGSTYHAVCLMENTIDYTDETRLLAEKLILSVTDSTQETIFYSMLPPLISMNISTLCEFDTKLTNAVQNLELPTGWHMITSGHTHCDTLLHFASKYNLSHLFSLLLSLPGGKDAIRIANKEGKYPIDLAKESGSHEITRIIEGLERESSPLASVGTSSTVPMLSVPNQRSSPYLSIMKEIDGNWIHKQKSHRNGLNVSPPSSKRPLNRFTIRPNSIAVMENLNTSEDSPTTCWLCAKDPSRKKSWSRIIGESRTRSVDTGMNELDRITDQILAHERLQDVRNMRNIPAIKGEWFHKWSFSCPVLLNDEVDTVSNDLIHSTLTSPGLFNDSSFSSAFSVPTYFSNIDPSDSLPPHQSLDTINNINGDGGGVHSTSPSVVPPQVHVCIEDENTPGICVPVTDKGGDDSTLKAQGQHIPYQYSTEDEEEANEKDDSFVHVEPEEYAMSVPLASKSAPVLQALDISQPPASPIKLNKSISTADTSYMLKVANTKSSNKISEESDDDNDMKTKSAVCLNTTPPNTELATPSETTPTSLKKTHHKSHSVSNIMMDPDMLDDGLTLPMPVEESRSRGSSFMSTSSKPDDTTDSSNDSDEEDDDFEPPEDGGGKTTLLLSLKKILKDDDCGGSSEDDSLDGEHVGGRRDRRMSEVRITMIDEVSDDEFSSPRPLPRSSTADDALSQSAQSSDDRKSITPLSHSPAHLKKNEIQLSDIDVSISSLGNNSSMGDNPQSTPPAASSSRSKESPVFKKENRSFNFSDSPQERHKKMSPKRTVKHLQTLIKLEMDDEPVFETPSMLSDDSDIEVTNNKGKKFNKSVTLPTDSPTQFRRRSPLLSHSDLKPHTKVVRNPSTASDSKVPYKMQSEYSSLDFVKPQDGHSSPRQSPKAQHSTSTSDSYTVNPPQSPLFFSKRSPIGDERPTADVVLSPKGQASPLEKRISRSADNLLSDPPKNEEKVHVDEEQNQNEDSPTKAKKKEDNNSVRLLRFQPLPGEGTNTDEETNSQHKDISKYYGIDQQEKEPPKKGAFKLFRRDSKKEKKPKRVESSHSVEHENGGQMRTNKKSQPSPVTRKQRANTVHGDSLNYPTSDQQPQQQSIPTTTTVSLKRVSQASTSSMQPPHDNISPVREESMSPPPSSPPDLSNSTLESDSSKFKFEEYPELMPSEEADVSWNRTVDRRLRKQMSKHEKGRQGVIYDWITTERHICRAYLILKKVFYDRFKSDLKMSDDELSQLFPSLTTLLTISQEFLQRLQDRQRQSGALIQDISDILLDQFTGPKGEKMKKAYTHFICLYPSTTEFYRELGKRRNFSRMINMIYQNKVCERKKLPDFYLLITQRVSKYVEMMKKLVKETEAMKLDHFPRVKESSVALTELVNAIDRGVYEYTSHKELTSIQNRLEINIPKSSVKQSKKLKDIKSLDFTAQNRFLLKRGDATWQGQLGQGKNAAVHVVLVTDFLVLLTERDQKYHLATLQDIQPPVVKLYDLHVRVNAAVKSGVQLLLVDQGEVPEIFRVEFSNKKIAKEWEEALNSAIHYCKENGLRCEYFGTEPILSGEENNKEEEEEERPDSGGDSGSNLSPSSYRRFIITLALEQANSILHVNLGPTSSATFGGSMMTIEEARESPRPSLKSNNKANRSTSQRAISVDESNKRKKKQVERGKSFLDKKSNEEQVERQVMVECITKLKESLELVLEQNEEQEKIIQKLKKDLENVREEHKQSDASSNSPATPRSQRGSFSRTRPHSLHSDLFETSNNMK